MRMPRYTNYSFNPYETKQEYFVRCTVCGWAGIDLERYQSPPDIAPIAFEVDEESGRTVTTVAAFAACPFCHSPRYDGGTAPDLLW